MDFHLSQAVAAAAQKEAELTAAHLHDRKTTIAAIEGTHEETLRHERRKSIQSLTTAETRHAEAVERTKAKYRKRGDRAAREAAEKAENAERARSKKRMKKLREKHRRKLVESERRAGRRALAQHVSSLQARVVANAYPGSCFSCGQGFGIFTRQHHCRGCGMAVCDTCSEHRISRKNLRLSQAQWDAMCEGDERLSGVAVDRWGGERLTLCYLMIYGAAMRATGTGICCGLGRMTRRTTRLCLIMTRPPGILAMTKAKAARRATPHRAVLRVALGFRL